MSPQVEPFTTRVRKATRKIHNVSDLLVNAKFAVSLTDEKVWAGGLFVFYHVFAFLEDAKERLNMPEYNKLFVHNAMYRKKAFEKDLEHYLGSEWRSLPRHEKVDDYLDNLKTLEIEHPKLLLAYVYHLYMGLLSGGQILAKKRKMFGKNNAECYIDEVTDFTNVDIAQLKNDVRKAMNEIAENMDPADQEAFIVESNTVFMYNNSIVNTVEGQAEVIRPMIVKTGLVVLAVGFAVLAYKMR